MEFHNQLRHVHLNKSTPVDKKTLFYGSPSTIMEEARNKKNNEYIPQFQETNLDESIRLRQQQQQLNDVDNDLSIMNPMICGNQPGPWIVKPKFEKK